MGEVIVAYFARTKANGRKNIGQVLKLSTQ